MNKIETLGHYFGYHAFRPGQEEVIDRILEGTDVLAIMPTGAGKSLCYQVPALMLPGTCLVISPLISLMKDQVMALKTAGVPAAYLNASLTEKQMHLAMERAANGAYKIIYVAPERLRTPGFQYLASRLEISLVAVDEAHCVSHWGHEFRPEYQKIAGFVQSLKTRPRYCAFTATATEEVRTDIIRLLELKRPYITVTGFDRPNLFFEVRHPKDRDSELISLCREMQSQAGIVYCMSRKNVETVCDLLRQEGLKATRYHAGLSDEERRENQDLFQFDKAQIMVATNAFGMGIDKSNVRYVIHYNLPLSMEGYYQEAGRAGRDGLESKCILLFQKRDIGLGEYLLENSESSADIPESQRIQIKDMEFRRFRDMQRYAETRGCLRHFILRYFGEKSAAVCGNCSSCRRMQHHALPGRLQKDRQDAGGAFARQREYAPVHTQRPKVPAAVQFRDSREADSLFDALVDLRHSLAAHAGLPPYIVCSDLALRNMEQALPLNAQELAEIDGMGYAKARAYGTPLLDCIRRWITYHEEREGSVSPDMQEQILALRKSGCGAREIAEQTGLPLLLAAKEIMIVESKPMTAPKVREKQTEVRVKQPSPAVRKRDWYPKEINWLRSLHEKKWTVHAIARQLGRKDMEIVEQLHLLGLKPKYDLPDEPATDEADLPNRE